MVQSGKLNVDPHQGLHHFVMKFTADHSPFRLLGMKDPAGEGAEFSLHGLRLGQQLLVAELASLERGLAGLAPRNLAKELAVAGRQSPGVVGQQGGALLHGGQRVAGDPVDPIDGKEGFGEEVLG